MTVPEPSPELLRQFEAFIASQQGTPAPLPNELPSLTIADVLKSLVRSARLPDEATVNQYCAVIDDHFPSPSAESSETAEA